MQVPTQCCSVKLIHSLTKTRGLTRVLPALVDPGCKKSHLAYITMTSGTTGKPKAIKNTHESATMCFLPRYDLYPYLPGGSIRFYNDEV